jgi:cytochrome c-type biogenesis protein CcmE
MMLDNGELDCTTLVTQCPSKYESATDALTIDQLKNYGPDAYDVTLKVTGSVQPGSIAPVSSAARLMLVDPASGEELAIFFNGGLPDGIKDDSILVVTGSLDSRGRFNATDIAIKE